MRNADPRRSPSRTRFVEALDSVRFGTPEDPDLVTAAPTAHAFIEVLWALLLGDTVVVPQSYAFDSAGFVGIASQMIEQRPSTGRGETWEPFQLSLFGQPSYVDMMASYLRKTPGDFVLSAMPGISESADDRGRLADLVLAGRFDRAATEYPLLEAHLDGLERLAVYFAGRDTIRARPTIGMEPRVAWIREVTELPEDPLAPSIDEEQLAQLRNGIAALVARGIALSNRSEVRTKGGDVVDEVTHRALVEMFDTVYNAALSESLRAQDESLTTRGTPEGLPLAGENTAQIALTRVIDGAIGEKPAATTRRGQRRPLGIEATGVPSLDATLQPVIGENLAQVWHIRSEPEFHESASALHRALEAGDGREAEDRLGEHLDLVSDWLADDLSIVPQGGLICQVKDVVEEAGAQLGGAVDAYVEHRLGIQQPMGEMAGTLLGSHLGEVAETKLAAGAIWRLLWQAGTVVESFES